MIIKTEHALNAQQAAFEQSSLHLITQHLFVLLCYLLAFQRPVITRLHWLQLFLEFLYIVLNLFNQF